MTYYTLEIFILCENDNEYIALVSPHIDSAVLYSLLYYYVLNKY